MLQGAAGQVFLPNSPWPSTFFMRNEGSHDQLRGPCIHPVSLGERKELERAMRRTGGSCAVIPHWVCAGGCSF